MKISLKQRLFIGFGVLTGVILGIGALSYFSINRILETDSLVDHTVDVISHLQLLEFNLKKAQAAYRSYLLFSNPELLRSSLTSLNLVEKTSQEAEKMTEDNPRQRENFSQFMPILKDRINRGRLNIQLCLEGHRDKAFAGFRTPENFRTNDDLDRKIDQTIVEEQNLLARRRDAEDASAHQAISVLVLGAITSTLFAFGALLTI